MQDIVYKLVPGLQEGECHFTQKVQPSDCTTFCWCLIRLCAHVLCGVFLKKKTQPFIECYVMK